MASPANRRSGTNRKAQLGVFTGYVVAGGGALLGAALLVISLLRPDTFDGLRTTAADVVSPVGEAGAVGRTGSQNIFDAIGAYYRAGSRNAALQEEMKVARVRLAEAEALRQENARLKAVLGLTESETPPVAVARPGWFSAWSISDRVAFALTSTCGSAAMASCWRFCSASAAAICAARAASASACSGAS